MDLRLPTAWQALVGRASTVRQGALLVMPGAPDRSFLLDKLTGRLRHNEGKPMPLDPETGAPPASNPLGEDFVNRLLRPWIERGAPDD